MTAVDGTGAAGTSAAEALAERLFAATLGASELQAVYLGDRLGWYRALSDHGPLTSTELADRTGTVERYAREWLEQQAVAGYVDVNSDADRRYSLPQLTPMFWSTTRTYFSWRRWRGCSSRRRRRCHVYSTLIVTVGESRGNRWAPMLARVRRY